MRRANMNQPGFENGQYQGQYQPTAEMLEEENTQLTDALRGKVQALKSSALQLVQIICQENRVMLAESTQVLQVICQENGVMLAESTQMSIDIGNEVTEQTKMLRSMDEDFDKSGNFLEATMARLKRLTHAGHYKLWIYLLLFVFFVLFMCWLIIRF